MIKSKKLLPPGNRTKFIVLTNIAKELNKIGEYKMEMQILIKAAKVKILMDKG